MVVEKTEYGYRSVKDYAAGVTELWLLLSNPKMLMTESYITLEQTNDHLKYTDSMRMITYCLHLIEAVPQGPIRYTLETHIPQMYDKLANLEILLEPKDEVRTRVIIKAKPVSLKFTEQMAATVHFHSKETLDGMTSISTELTVFHGFVDNAITSNLPYIRDVMIVKGDYVGAKIEIENSVLTRTDIKVDGKPPPNIHVRADTYVPGKVKVKDSVVQRSDIGGGSGGGGEAEIDGSVVMRSGVAGGEGEVTDNVVVGKRTPDKVGGAAVCLDDPNLETYRTALERAMADGTIVEKEENMLRVLRSSLGISLEQHERILETIRLSTDKNVQTYRRLLAEAMMDGEIDPDEAAILEGMRQSLGITDTFHERLVDDVRKSRGQ